MILKRIFAISLLLLTLKCFAQNATINELKYSFEILNSNNSSENQISYLKAFPDNFEEFITVFGYDADSSSNKNLYDGYEYIEKFFLLDKIDNEMKLNRIINICVNAKWEADAVNYFQHFSHDIILKDIDQSYKLLSKKSHKQIISFFNFFFSETHGRFKQIPSEFQYLKDLDNVFYSIIQSSFIESHSTLRH